MIACMDGTKEERTGVRIAGKTHATDFRVLADLRGESVETHELGPVLPFELRFSEFEHLHPAWHWLAA